MSVFVFVVRGRLQWGEKVFFFTLPNFVGSFLVYLSQLNISDHQRKCNIKQR